MTKVPDHIKPDAGNARFLKIQEVAARLQLSPRTIYRLVDDGQLPVYRIGRSVRICLTDLAQFMRAKRDPGHE